jgi:hypothetical protein
LARKRTRAQDPDKTWFEPDPEPYSTPQEKNDRLADLLKRKWNDLLIVSIRRLEIGVQGWEATYRPT